MRLPMKITLIQIDLVMGSRILLALLHEMGYHLKSLQINIRYTDLLSQEDLDIIYEYVRGSDVVGLSFNTFYAVAARELALYLKRRGIKFIVTGGNHVTALPEEAIEYSDIVVKSEAELTLPKILEALKHNRLKDLSHVKGIVYKDGSEVICNNGAPDIVWELDSIPFQSVDTDMIKYFNCERKLYTPGKRELFPHADQSYFILASRGCPFICTYCSNSLYQSIASGLKTVRKRSIDNIIGEMEYGLSNGFESFRIYDDNFFSFTLDEIEEFSREYMRRVKRPFSVMGVNPNNFRSTQAEKKLKLLIDCGLVDIRIGVQSGSDKTLTIFKRGYKAKELPGLLAPIERNRRTIWDSPYDKLHVALDFICDAAWETEEDKIATIRLAQEILSEYSIFFYTLIYLPGTDIYKEGLKKGWIDDRVKDIYLRGIAGIDDNIHNRMLFLIAITKERGFALPNRLIDHILQLAKDAPETAEGIIDSIIHSMNKIEEHHKVNLKHAASHPYLTGFNKWTKTKGDVGREVLFRSYHEPYG